MRHPTSDRGEQLIIKLLSRIRLDGDFPAMAQAVAQIGRLTSSEDTSCNALADTILQDYGLANKILRLVNTVAYAQCREVTTISRAVLLIGFERIRTIATGFMVFEHLRRHCHHPELAERLSMSFYSAVLARTIARGTQFVDAEEAFISALFQQLGRILVAFYLPDAYAEVGRSAEPTEQAAVIAVLGLSYERIGLAVAEALKLPDKLTRSLARIPGSRATGGLDEAERLGCLSTVANDITAVLTSDGVRKNKTHDIQRLLKSYGRHFADIGNGVDDLITSSLAELSNNSAMFGVTLHGGRLVHALDEWKVPTPAPAAPAAEEVPAWAAGPAFAPAADDAPAGEESPETILTNGLHELTSLMLGNYVLDDVLRVVLETIYRALGVRETRVFFLLRDPSQPVIRYRFGFGDDADEAGAWLRIPLDGGRDPFNVAVDQQKDLVLKSLAEPEVARYLPDWYRQHIPSDRFLMLLPLVIDGRTVGLFYIDGDPDNVAALTPAIFTYFRVLRSQAVLAIKQKSQPR
jgi:HD-like signal output (HDOD) protein